MKTIFLCSLALLVSISAASAKGKKGGSKGGYSKGQSSLHIGIGYPSLINPSPDSLKYYGDVKKSGLPPILASFGYGLIDNVEVGGLLALSTCKYTVTDKSDSKDNGLSYTLIVVGARAAYHISLLKMLDTYVNVMGGYKLALSSAFGENKFLVGPGGLFVPEKGGLVYSAHLGAAYSFTKNIGAFVELGYGVSIANLGVNIKF